MFSCILSHRFQLEFLFFFVLSGNMGKQMQTRPIVQTSCFFEHVMCFPQVNGPLSKKNTSSRKDADVQMGHETQVLAGSLVFLRFKYKIWVTRCRPGLSSRSFVSLNMLWFSHWQMVHYVRKTPPAGKTQMFRCILGHRFQLEVLFFFVLSGKYG